MPNSKTPVLDGIHRWCFKKFNSIHDGLAIEINWCLQETDILEWMAKGKLIQIQKDPQKGTASKNYRPITRLSMMRSILIAQISEIYFSLISRGLFPEEQKECCKGTRYIGELQYIDQHVLNESKTRQKIWLWRGLTTKRLMIWSLKTG